MARKSGSKCVGGRTRNRTGLRNRRRNGAGSYATKGKGRRAEVYDRPLFTYKDPALAKSEE